jgi:hypothetical protein
VIPGAPRRKSPLGNSANQGRNGAVLYAFARVVVVDLGEKLQDTLGRLDVGVNRIGNTGGVEEGMISVLIEFQEGSPVLRGMHNTRTIDTPFARGR